MRIPGRGTRLWRGALAGLVIATLFAPVSAAARQAAPAPAPAVLPVLSTGTLETRYAANRANIVQAARMADKGEYHQRAAALRAMAHSARMFLSFDARGKGRAVEVLGDLATARRISVLVPGTDTTLDTYDALGPKPHARLGWAVRSLKEQISRLDPAANVAVVAWLGYTPPQLISTDVVTTSRAEDGARALRAFVGSVRRANPAAQVSLLCHSYGSVVCGRAAAGLAVSDIAMFGSPGAGAETAAGLGTAARVWAGRGARDWIGGVPHLSLPVFGTTIGFGADPVSGGFGARPFAAGDGGHGDYLAPGSASVANLARIALGHDREVTR